MIETRGRRLAAAALPLLLASVLPPQAAAQQETVSVGECQASIWRGLPLAKSVTPSDEYYPNHRSYYQDWALKSILPPFVLACFAAALLLAFALWRLVKLATCVRCIRGPRRAAKAAADTLGGRTHLWLQVAVALLACGVVAGSGYAFSQIQPSLESDGVAVYEQAKAYVADGLATANRTIDALSALGADVADVRQRVIDLNLDSLQPGALEEVEGFSRDIAAVGQGLSTATRDIQGRVLDRMQQLQEDWQPTADRLDVAKNAALYACFSLLIASAAAAALGVALNCPGLANPSLFALLLLLVLAWAAAWAATTGLKVGSDGCQVVEQKVLEGLVGAAERQVAGGGGGGLLATVGVGDTLAMARYFLFGVGRKPAEVLTDLTGWDIPQLIGRANATVVELGQAAALLSSSPELANSSLATLPDNLSLISADLAAVAGNVSELEAVLSYQRFHPLYLTVKQYACCDVLNWLGGLWLALLVCGCCGVPMALVAFWWVGRMDLLEPRGCCHCYRRSDYEAFREEEPAAGRGSAAASLPEKKDGLGGEEEEEEDGGLAGPALSLRAKLASAGAAGAWARGSGAAGRTPRSAGGADDAFTIGALPPQQQMQQMQQQQPQPQQGDGSSTARSARGLELAELLPAGTPSAPPLPLSARSLPGSSSARYSHSQGGIVAAGRAGAGTLPLARSSSGGAGQQQYAWAAAAASGSAPPSARGAGGGSAASSALNSARGLRAGIPHSVPLTPAAVALLPPSDEEEPSSGSMADLESPAAGGSEAASATAGAGGGSALKRAGNALGRLKFLRRGDSHK